MIKIASKGLNGLLVISLLVVMAMFVVGCGGSNSENEVGNNDENSELSGRITIAGSTSVQPFVEVVADKFMDNHPKTQVNVQGGGSSQGYEAALSGAADIGMSSRKSKQEELAQGIKEYTLALDGIAIIVNPSNSIANLTLEQVREIYLGNIKDWSEVGGVSGAITVVCREAGSGTRGAFEDIVMNKQDISNTVIIQNSTGAVRTTVAGDKNAIGFVSLAALNNDVNTIKIDNIEPTVANIIAGTYKVSRPFLLLTKGESDGLAKAFIEFALSEEGQAIVVEEGAISPKQ